MSTSLRDLSKQFEDKEFVKTYFYGVENGQDVTNRLVRDNASLNSPDLIARLVGWLEEAEPTDDAANKQAQTQQQLSSMKLPSQQESSSSSKETSSSGEESSDGTTRTNTGSSGKSNSFELGRASSGTSK